MFDMIKCLSDLNIIYFFIIEFINIILFHYVVQSIQVHHDDPVFTTAYQVTVTDAKF